MNVMLYLYVWFVALLWLYSLLLGCALSEKIRRLLNDNAR